jgi:S-adenosylmethionine:diacylglycerol 3-amino-3-carboxypropyl transferase
MPTNDMLCTRASNLIFSTALFSENNEATVIDMSKFDGSQNTRVILRGSQGVNIANAAEIVYYT